MAELISKTYYDFRMSNLVCLEVDRFLMPNKQAKHFYIHKQICTPTVFYTILFTEWICPDQH